MFGASKTISPSCGYMYVLQLQKTRVLLLLTCLELNFLSDALLHLDGRNLFFIEILFEMCVTM